MFCTCHVNVCYPFTFTSYDLIVYTYFSKLCFSFHVQCTCTSYIQQIIAVAMAISDLFSDQVQKCCLSCTYYLCVTSCVSSIFIIMYMYCCLLTHNVMFNHVANTCILLQGKDEAVFLEFRDRLKVFFNNIALLVSEISTIIENGCLAKYICVY